MPCRVRYGRERRAQLDVLFAGTLTIALYTVTDMEYPRLGLIRIESFDHFLADAYEQRRLNPQDDPWRDRFGK